MPSTNNLAQMFAQSQQQNQQGSSQNSNSSNNIPRSSKSPSPSTYSVHSKAVDAENDDHFESSTFALKRTRSVGLLDEFIAPTRKLIEADQQEKDGNIKNKDNEDEEDEEDDSKRYDIDYDENNNNNNNNYNNDDNNKNNNFNINNNDNDDDENQFIEDIDDETYKSKQKKKTSNVYSYDDDYNTYSSYENDENASMSPSPPDTPDLYQPHDDNDIVYEPQRHVDYLSHNWKEGDISKSWRYIVLKRKDVANSARLENASWRTWAQAKYHLKTISPEAVNWLKDSDVTWLYGPLYKEPSHSSSTNKSTKDNNNNDDDKKYGSDSESTSKISTAQPLKSKRIKGPKPILKKRTVSEMLSQPSMIKLPPRHHSPNIGSSTTHSNLPSPPHIDDDFDLISSRVNAQYNKPSSSSTNLNLRNQYQNQQAQQQQVNPSQLGSNVHNASNIGSNNISAGIESNKIPNSGTSIDSMPKKSEVEEPVVPPKRRIHFNDRVEQCMAVYIPDSDDEQYEGDEELNEEDSDSDEEEGGFFLQVRAQSTPQIHNKEFASTLSSNDANSSTDGDKHIKYQTIEILPCTTLKHGSDEEDESDQDDNKFALSHNTNTSRGFNYYYDYNSVYPSDHVQIGNSDYAMDSNPHHLEGVKMVDVPENIVLGSNVEIEDTPTFAEPQHIQEQVAIEQKEAAKEEKDHKSSYKPGAFDFHSDGSSSEEEQKEQEVDLNEDEVQSTSSALNNSKPLSENPTKISSSPSYASLSDVAAQGYISQSMNKNNNLSDIVSKNYNNNNEPNDNKPDEVNELRKDFGNLSPSEEKSGFKHTFLKNWKRN